MSSFTSRTSSAIRAPIGGQHGRRRRRPRDPGRGIPAHVSSTASSVSLRVRRKHERGAPEAARRGPADSAADGRRARGAGGSRTPEDPGERRRGAAAYPGHPAFQENGVFIGAERYRQLLSSQNPPMTTTEFEEGIRRALIVEKLRASVTEWLSVSEREIEQEYLRRNDKVKLAVATILSESVRGTVSASDGEVSTYFEAHKDDFKIPEKRKVRYLLVDTDAMRAKMSVPAADVERAYNDNFELCSTPEQIRASHILLQDGRQGRSRRQDAGRRSPETSQSGSRLRAARHEELGRRRHRHERRRPGLLWTRPDGPGIRRSGLRATAAGADQRPGQDAVRVPHHQARGKETGIDPFPRRSAPAADRPVDGRACAGSMDLRQACVRDH